METVFLVCAATGGTVLVLQLLAGLLGLGGDHAADHDAGHLDHDHDQDHPQGTSWFAGLITFRSVTAGVTFFGLCGMTALWSGLNEAKALMVAVAGGLVAVYLVGQAMRAMKRLSEDGSARVERAVGLPGVVYLAVPGNNAGPGKVTLTLQKRTVEYAAYTAAAGLPTGAKVRVVAVRGPAAVDVEPIEPAALSPPLPSVGEGAGG